MFREDLYYRLNVFPVLIDPLRKRQEDIIPLTNFFIQKYNQEFGLHKSISPAALNLLSVSHCRATWRELQNIIQHAMINTTFDEIKSSDILHTFTCVSRAHGRRAAYRGRTAAAPRPASLKQMLEEKEREILLDYSRYYRTTQQLADALHTSQPTIVRKLQKYRIRSDEG